MMEVQSTFQSTYIFFFFNYLFILFLAVLGLSVATRRLSAVAAAGTTRSCGA